MRKIVRSAAGMPRRRARARRQAPALEWLQDMSGAAARATVTGSRRALIENHTGILEFTEQCVRLNSRRGEITVRGEELSLAEVRPRSLIVLGRIDSVELPPEGDDALD